MSIGSESLRHAIVQLHLIAFHSERFMTCPEMAGCFCRQNSGADFQITIQSAKLRAQEQRLFNEKRARFGNQGRFGCNRPFTTELVEASFIHSALLLIFPNFDAPALRSKGRTCPLRKSTLNLCAARLRSERVRSVLAAERLCVSMPHVPALLRRFSTCPICA